MKFIPDKQRRSRGSLLREEIASTTLAPRRRALPWKEPTLKRKIFPHKLSVWVRRFVRLKGKAGGALWLAERLESVNKGEKIIFLVRDAPDVTGRWFRGLVNKRVKFLWIKFRHFSSRGCGSENQLSPRRNTDADCESFPINARKEFSPSQEKHRLDKFRGPGSEVTLVSCL